MIRLYEGCPMYFTIEPGTSWNSTGIRSYPVEPPRVLFHSQYSIRCHPNLYQSSGMGPYKSGGKVCLSILGTWMGPGWGAMMTFMTIAQTIMSILDNHPLCNEPAYYNKPNSQVVKNYTEYIQYICLKEFIEKLNSGSPISNMFVDELNNWVDENHDQYMKRLIHLSEIYDGQIIHSCDVYHNNTCIGKKYNYKSLIDKMINDK